MLDHTETASTNQLLRRRAVAHMAHERWRDAAELLDRMSARDGDAEMRWRLCRNLEALRQHRPAVYRAIAEADFGDRYQLIPAKGGLQTIAMRSDNGQLTSLSPDNDPIAAAQRIMRQLDSAMQNGAPLALAGIGDGHLLSCLASDPREHYLGRRQAIYLFEPDPRLVLACCMLHDYSGDDGPITQPRVHWHIGTQWFDDFRREYFADLFLPFPTITIRQGISSAAMAEQLTTMLRLIAELDAQHAATINGHYRSLTRDELVSLLGPNPPRRPRVMLLTSIYSTVLQYSTRDTADAFAALGWDVHISIEPSLHHCSNGLALRAELARFKPDLVFQIDHLRHEHQQVIPQSVPFVCWVQDNLPNLTSSAAAAAVDSRQFVLIPSVQRYIRQYGYPPRQCMEFRKLSRSLSPPISWRSDGDDVVYVSNWSRPPQLVIEELVKDLAPLVPPLLINTCCARIVAEYEHGRSLATPGDIRGIYEHSCRDLCIRGTSRQLELLVINQLFERVNNCLYRQQALAWVADVAQELNLSLAIYGRGWESNPKFAQHARGVIEYGPTLEETTRRARINLVLEPFVSIAHQRLLDGLLAGGFFLVRAHPQNQLLRELLELLAPHDPAVVYDIPTALAVCDGQQRQRLQLLLDASAAADATPGQFDVIAAVRNLRASGFLAAAPELLPHLDEISFDGRQQLLQRARQFLADEAPRRAIANAQRQVVEQRFTYVSGIRKVIAFVHERLAQEPAAQS